MTVELKPCPFCGGEAIRCGDNEHNRRHWVMCRKCHACPEGDLPTLTEAEAAWNRRADPLSTRIATLEAALRAKLVLLHSLANDITEANYADKRLYILQTCVRMSDDLAALASQPDAPVDRSGWSIDTSTGTDILMKDRCSVIEDENAHYVLRLIEADRSADAPVDVAEEPDDSLTIAYLLGAQNEKERARAEVAEECARIAESFAACAYDGVIGSRSVKQEKQAMLRDLAAAIRARFRGGRDG